MPKCRICDKRLPPDVQLCPKCGAPAPNDFTAAAPRGENPDLPRRDQVDAGGVDAEIQQELVRLIQSNRKLEAIKLYRKQCNCGLAEAKGAIESLSAKLAPSSAGGGSGCTTVLVAIVTLVTTLSVLLA